MYLHERTNARLSNSFDNYIFILAVVIYSRSSKHSFFFGTNVSNQRQQRVTELKENQNRKDENAINHMYFCYYMYNYRSTDQVELKIYNNCRQQKRLCSINSGNYRHGHDVTYHCNASSTRP